jgi:DNA primase
MDIQALKATVSLTDVASAFDIAITKGDGREPCPFCHSHSAFKVTRNTYYICYKCGRRGDIMNLLVDAGISKNYKEAYAAIKEIGGSTEVATTVYRQSLNELEEIHSYFLDQAKLNPSIIEQFAASRGFSDLQTLSQVGYCPANVEPDYRLKQLLVKHSLWYDSFKSHEECAFANRIVFPIKNASGRVVHFTARAVDNNVERRWLHSQSKPSINHYLYNLEEIYHQRKHDYVILTEGVTDCLALLQLGEPAVGCFGVNSPLVQHAWALKHISHLVAVFDRDKYPLGTERAGEYKSWSGMTPALIELALDLNIPIFCCMVPDWSGVKDINDYLKIIDYNRAEFKRFLANNAVPLGEFAFELYKQRPKYHESLWRLAKQSDELKLCLRDYVEKRYACWSDYVKELF